MPTGAKSSESVLEKEKDISDPETEKQFKNVRVFGREKQEKERNELAANLREKRRAYFSRKNELSKKLENILNLAENKKINAKEVGRKIEEAEGEIDRKSANMALALLNRKNIKLLEEEVALSKISESSLFQDLEELEGLKNEIEISLEDRSVIEEARKSLRDFYKGAEEKWNNYETDRRDGNIRNIMRAHGAFVVHAFISPTLSPSDENGAIRKELSWRDKLDLTMVLEPTISASAVDINHPETFAPVGALVCGGFVQSASSRDLGSQVINQRFRTTPKFLGIPERVGEQIKEALRPDNKLGWTEFVVSQPKIGGIFFRLEDNGRLADLEWGSDASISEVVDFAKERDLPLFALRAGNFYAISRQEALEFKSKYAQKTEELEDRKLTAEHALEIPTGLDLVRKEELLEKFMNDSPFQLKKFPEAGWVSSFAKGRSLYHLYSKNNKSGGGYRAMIPPGNIGNTEEVPVTVLKSIPGPTHIENFVKLENGDFAVWSENRHTVSQRSRQLAGACYSQDRLLTSESLVYVGSYALPKNPNDIMELLEEARKETEKMREYVQDWERKGDAYYSKSWINALKNCASFLYGVAQEANEAGDNEVMEVARRLAEGIFPPEEFEDMKKRRISETGTFKISKEELLGV